mmetsp:Transcript_49097/g.129792  ORF Transcript_49097/g.129792 Transcript_49097/m.129792 type:complete len:348 (-) Transcript_49097:76-1119(-)
MRDEGHRVRRHLLDALLHDVVAVHALDAVDDAPLQLPREQHLHLGRRDLDRLLDHAAAVHPVRQLQHLAVQLADDRLALLRRPDLQEALHHLAPGDVAGELRDVGQHRLAEGAAAGGARRLQARLEELAALRVARQLARVEDELPQREVALRALPAHLAERGAAPLAALAAHGRVVPPAGLHLAVVVHLAHLEFLPTGSGAHRQAEVRVGLCHHRGLRREEVRVHRLHRVHGRGGDAARGGEARGVHRHEVRVQVHAGHRLRRHRLHLLQLQLLQLLLQLHLLHLLRLRPGGVLRRRLRRQLPQGRVLQKGLRDLLLGDVVGPDHGTINHHVHRLLHPVAHCDGHRD